MAQLGITGKITVDKLSNLIPGAARTRPGNGIADIILWGKDKVYVWEIKGVGGQGKFDGQWMENKAIGPKQLSRYVDYLQAKLKGEGNNREVVKGFGLPTSESFSVKEPGAVIRTWSGTPPVDLGIRYYGPPEQPKRQPQQQTQPQPQPQGNPCVAAFTPGLGCGGGLFPFPLPFPEGPGVPLPGLPGLPPIGVPVPGLV